MDICVTCGANVQNRRFCGDCGTHVQYNNERDMAKSAALVNQTCPRCAASLANGTCEYCGWNSPAEIVSKTLTLPGVMCNLTVKKETSTFKPSIGAASVIDNKDISQVSLTQAPITGTGELTIRSVTGFSQSIRFLYPQNPKMGEIASYLLHIAPDANFITDKPIAEKIELDGVTCPKCKSYYTKSTGRIIKYTVWKIVLGIMLIISGIGASSINAAAVLSVLSGIALAAFGFGLAGRKKSECLCLNCRRKFGV